VLYVYGFASADGLSALPGWTASDGVPVRVSVCAGVAAIWSPLPASALQVAGGDGVPCDPRALAELVMRHEAALQRAMRSGPVFPVPFGLAFSAEPALVRYTEERSGVILPFLAEAAGKHEWAVTGTLDREAAKAALAERLLLQEGDVDAMSPGVRYLAVRRSTLRATQEIGARLDDACAEIGRRLTGCASAARRRGIFQTGEEPAGAEVILNWAFLVDAADLPAFQREVSAVTGEAPTTGISLRLAGPLAPYSFTPALEGGIDGCAH
jgi:hypothetical protein